MTNNKSIEGLLRKLWDSGYYTGRAEPFDNLTVPEAKQALRELIEGVLFGEKGQVIPYRNDNELKGMENVWNAQRQRLDKLFKGETE